MILGWKVKAKAFESDDVPVLVFHQDHLVPGFLTGILVRGIPKPNSQRASFLVVQNLYLL